MTRHRPHPLDDHAAYHATLTAKLAAGNYRPALMRATDIAAVLGVTVQAVYMWGKRAERTGVRRYPCGRYDVNAVALWELTRDSAQASRRRKQAAA